MIGLRTSLWIGRLGAAALLVAGGVLAPAPASAQAPDLPGIVGQALDQMQRRDDDQRDERQWRDDRREERQWRNAEERRRWEARERERIRMEERQRLEAERRQRWEERRHRAEERRRHEEEERRRRAEWRHRHGDGRPGDDDRYRR